MSAHLVVPQHSHTSAPPGLCSVQNLQLHSSPAASVPGEPSALSAASTPALPLRAGECSPRGAGSGDVGCLPCPLWWERFFDFDSWASLVSFTGTDGAFSLPSRSFLERSLAASLSRFAASSSSALATSSQMGVLFLPFLREIVFASWSASSSKSVSKGFLPFPFFAFPFVLALESNFPDPNWPASDSAESLAAAHGLAEVDTGGWGALGAGGGCGG
mmetsp:Transcript_4895/g.9185  ORF Transcript_4895/g.9185 Transcript_4895/m.9185 type:complete len:217 (-) Transcript_4895:1041-1691(-)